MLRRFDNRIGGALQVLCIAAAFAATAGGCSARKAPPAEQPAAPPPPPAEAEAAGPTPSAPTARIDISYAHRNDYLGAMTVTKYGNAQLIATRKKDAKDTASIVRFGGGVVVWQVQAGSAVLAGLPGLGLGSRYRVAAVKYGELPKHFSQVVPDSGPPEPLEPGHYYVFSVQRASGSQNFEAVKVEADGTLEAYSAQPRAGSSYELCCNLSQDFTQSASAGNPVQLVTP